MGDATPLRAAVVLALLLAGSLPAGPFLPSASAQGAAVVTAAVGTSGGALTVDLRADETGKVLVVVTHEDPILGTVADRVVEANVSPQTSRVTLDDLRLGTNFTVRVLEDTTTLPGLADVSRLLDGVALGQIPTLAQVAAPLIPPADANHTREIEMYPIGGGYDMLGTVTTRRGAAVALFLTSPNATTNAIVAWTSLDGGHEYTGPVEVARFNRENRNWAFSEVDGGVAVLVREYNRTYWAPGEELDVDPWRLSLFDPHAQRVVHTVNIGTDDRVRLGVGNYQFAFLPDGDVMAQFQGSSEERNENGQVVRQLTHADGFQVWRLQQDGDITFVTAVPPPTPSTCDMEFLASKAGQLAIVLFPYEENACNAQRVSYAIAQDGRTFGPWSSAPSGQPAGYQPLIGNAVLDEVGSLLVALQATRFEPSTEYEGSTSVDSRAFLLRIPSAGAAVAHELRVPGQTEDPRSTRPSVVADGLRSWVVWLRAQRIWSAESLDGGASYGAPVQLRRAGSAPDAPTSLAGEVPLALLPDGRPLLMVTEAAESFSAPLYEPVLDDALLARIVPTTLGRLTVEVLQAEPPVLVPGGMAMIQARVRSTASTALVAQLSASDASGRIDAGSARLELPAFGVAGAALTIRASSLIVPGGAPSLANVALRATAAGVGGSTSVVAPVRVIPTPLELLAPAEAEVDAGRAATLRVRLRNVAPIPLDATLAVRTLPEGVRVDLREEIVSLAPNADALVSFDVHADETLASRSVALGLEARTNDAAASLVVPVRLVVRALPARDAAPPTAATPPATPPLAQATPSVPSPVPSPIGDGAPAPGLTPPAADAGQLGDAPRAESEGDTAAAPASADDGGGAGPAASPEPVVTIPPVVVAGGGAAVATALAAGVVATEAGRSGVALLAAALYSRLRRSRILEHGARQAVYELVQRQPGMRFEELRRATSSSYGALAYHLKVLEREGLLTSRIDWAHRRFYPSGIAPVSAQARAVGDRIVAALQSRPGMSQADVARALSMSRQLASYHLAALEKAGRVAVVRQGRSVRYSAVSARASPSEPPTRL